MSKSKHIAALVIIAVVTLAVILIIRNPEFISDIWLWIIGLIGPIIGFVREGIRAIGKNLKEDHATEVSEPDKKEPTEPGRIQQLETKIESLERQLSIENLPLINSTADTFAGTTLTVLRYQDDGQTTLGLLFIENKFYCYTLEDTYRPEKIASQTRIPAGTYHIEYNRFDSPLTIKYRKTRPWFKYHLEIKNVPGYSGIYIHSGGTHEHTAGCLLVSNGILATDLQKILNNSRVTYEHLYKLLSKKLSAGEKIRIKLENEQWFKKYLNYERASQNLV